MITCCFHSSLDVSELAKAAKKKLQSVSKILFLDVANSALRFSGFLAQGSLDPSAVGTAWNTQIFCEPSLFIEVHISSGIWYLIPTAPLPHPKHKRSLCCQMGEKKKIYWPGKEKCRTEWLALYLEIGWSYMSAPCAGWERSISMN